MEFVRTDWTIVLVGTWNVGIFQPQWLSSHVFGEQPIELEVQIGMPPALRFHCGQVSLIVGADRLVGTVREVSQEAHSRLAEALCGILTSLPHTPVTAVGINFGFREVVPDKSLLANFDMADNIRLTNFGASILQTSVLRELRIEEGVLRLKNTLEDDGSLHYHLNFHSDVADAASANTLIGTTSKQKMKRAYELLSTVYGLSVEGESEKN